MPILSRIGLQLSGGVSAVRAELQRMGEARR
jgi:hypothetical protein